MAQAKKQDHSVLHTVLFGTRRDYYMTMKYRTAVKTSWCNLFFQGRCRKGDHCTYCHTWDEYGQRVRDYESEGFKIEYCRYHFGFDGRVPYSCTKGNDCQWAHCPKDVWNHGQEKKKDSKKSDNYYNNKHSKEVNNYYCDEAKGHTADKKKEVVGPQTEGRRQHRPGFMMRRDEKQNSSDLQSSATHGQGSLVLHHMEGPQNNGELCMSDEEEPQSRNQEGVKGICVRDAPLVARDDEHADLSPAKEEGEREEGVEANKINWEGFVQMEELTKQETGDKEQQESKSCGHQQERGRGDNERDVAPALELEISAEEEAAVASRREDDDEHADLSPAKEEEEEEEEEEERKEEVKAESTNWEGFAQMEELTKQETGDKERQESKSCGHQQERRDNEPDVATVLELKIPAEEGAAAEEETAVASRREEEDGEYYGLVGCAVPDGLAEAEATEVAGLEAEEGAVAAAATEEEAPNDSHEIQHHTTDTRDINRIQYFSAV